MIFQSFFREININSNTSHFFLILSFFYFSINLFFSSHAEPGTSKKVAMLNMTNQLFQIYFQVSSFIILLITDIFPQINKLNLLKPLIRAIDNCGNLYNEFLMADKVAYNYFLGRKAMFDADLNLGEN